MDRVDALVVGAGVIGLAVARELARAGYEVIVIDAAEGIGTVTSARNSEVIHAGLYYAPGSRKAQLCVEGRARLYAHCAERGLAHRRCGKLVVAVNEEEVPAL
jgi:L-2-hydroxyglutarate oxidase LhgO